MLVGLGGVFFYLVWQVAQENLEKKQGKKKRLFDWGSEMRFIPAEKSFLQVIRSWYYCLCLHHPFGPNSWVKVKIILNYLISTPF